MFTIDLPTDAPREKILDIVNDRTRARVLGLIDEEGNEGSLTVQLTEPATSVETIRNLIQHCCQTLPTRKRFGIFG